MLQPVRTQDAIEVAVKVADFPAATRPPTAAELASIVLAEKSQWPAVQGLKADGSVETGPTGSPWVNSNSAMVRALAAQHPGKQIWLPAKLPAAAQPNSAILALADAAICGGRWVASADGNIQQMRDAMEFFETHREWANWDAVAALGVISNFETSLGVGIPEPRRAAPALHAYSAPRQAARLKRFAGRDMAFQDAA